MMSTKAESNRSGKVHRSWGYYKVLHQENDTVKVKELVVNFMVLLLILGILSLIQDPVLKIN